MSINSTNNNYRKLIDSIPNNVQFLFSTEQISSIQRGVIVDDNYIYSSAERNVFDSDGNIWSVFGDLIKYSATGSVIASAGGGSVRKYDSDLNLLHSFTIDTTASYHITIDNSDNIYIGSNRGGTPAYSVRSYSPTASLRWQYDPGESALVIHTNNNYVFVGEGNATSGANPRITVLSLTGSLIKTISVPSNLRFGRNDMISDSDNNIYARTFDNNNGNSVVRKLDFDGNVLWSRTDISSIYGGIFLDGDYVYVSGSANATVNPAVGYSVLKLDKNTGNLIWKIDNRSIVSSTVDFCIFVKDDKIYTAGSNLCSPNVDCSNPKRGPVVVYSQN